VLDRNPSVTTELAPAGATPTLDKQPRRLADFGTIGEALDYAAKGRCGLNFHDARGSLQRAYPFSELREDAIRDARRFVALAILPGDRIALPLKPLTRPASSEPSMPAPGSVPLPLPTSFAAAKPHASTSSPRS
jgi:fatty-acyl-CoA synthase